MHHSRIIIAFTALAGMATAFLPWKTEAMLGEKTNVAGTGSSILLGSMQVGDGWITILIFAIIVLLVITGRRNEPVKILKNIILLLLAAGLISLTAYEISQMKKLSVDIPGSNLATQVYAGYGLYLTLLLSIVAGTAVILFWKKKQMD